nr:MAG TPA: hypothetical protein [Caudoviricetes sp.]
MHLHGQIPQLAECTIKEDWHRQSTVGGGWLPPTIHY